MMEGLGWMVAAHLALLLLSHALLRRVRTSLALADATLFLVIHLLLVSVVVLLAGSLGVLRPRVLGPAGAVLLGILLAAGEHRRLPAPVRPQMGRGTAVLAALIGLRMLLEVWFLAPTNGDILSYHLTKIAEWVRAGAFTREMGPDNCAPFPAGFEIVETWWVVFLHHDVVIELAGVEYALLGFLSVGLLARGVGMSPRSSWLASTLYLLTPAFNLQAVSCANDAPVAALILCMAAWIVRGLDEVVLLLPLGLILGMKSTGLFTLPGWVFLWIVRRREPGFKLAQVRWVWPLAAAAIGAGCFWYLRNTLWYGNPVYPVTRGGGSPGVPGIAIQTGPDLRSLWYNLSELFGNRIYDNRMGFTTTTTAVAGWGLVAFAVGAVSAVLEIRRDPAFRRLAAAFGIAAASVLLMVNADEWVMRFILFFPAILSLAAARAAESARPVAILLAGCALFDFAGTMLPQDLPSRDVAALIRQPWRERSAAPFYHLVPPAPEVAVYATRRTYTYLLYGPDYSHRVVYLRVSGPEEVAPAMERLGLRAVHVRLTPRRMYDFEDLVGRGRFRKLTSELYSLP